MTACLRTLTLLALAALLAACASTPTATLGELPRTPQASIEELLQQASTSQPLEAANLRLAAADKAYKSNDNGQAARILEQVKIDSLLPAQQIFASTLQAELALARKRRQRPGRLASTGSRRKKHWHA